MPAKKKAPSLPSLCVAVKAIREMYGDTQEQFAQRVSMGSMTISRFERGVAIPRDPVVLQKLAAVAEEADLPAESEQFRDAYREALVNRMYPGPAAVQPTLSISFQTVPEWRLMMIALFAARYDGATARAIEAAGGPVCAVVDQVMQDADIGKGIGPDLFRGLEVRIKALMDAQALKTTREDR
jgi:transcriptional regulator with XRE-family HTH domain